MKVAIRRIASKTDKPIAIFIDYLQLMKSTSSKEREDLRIAEISGELKRIALDYQCPVICLSQLNRGVEQRQDKRPVMSDLRDSGSIEQDADKILLLYRSDYYNRDQEPTNELDVIIAKNREGQVGTATIKFYLETGVMRN
jgi:replicative DNA helicase